MSTLPGIENEVRASAKGNPNIWSLEWTYSDGSGTPVLDTAVSDRDARVATPVADGGTGITNVSFPKCGRLRILGARLIPATAATGSLHLLHAETDQSASGGTLKVRFFSNNGTPIATDPDSGARFQLHLMLDYS
jgi:hypothetical protein